MLLVDCAELRSAGVGFEFFAEETESRPEGLIAYDTGARLYAQLQAAGRTCEAMPAAFRRSYRHDGNLSWGNGLSGTRLRDRLVRAGSRARDRRLRALQDREPLGRSS